MSYYLQRDEFLVKASLQEHGLIVIGGGITGCGIALDAQTRGIPTLVLEMRDIASGTSSRSTKLIHGGLRYLKQMEFGLVQETGRERAVVYALAPHITVPEPMLLPIVKGGSMPKWMASLGTFIYDWLAGVKDREQRKVLSKEFTLKKEPLLDPVQTTGGIYYYEYRTDDARLSMAVARTAIDKGARIYTYVKVHELIYEAGKIKGVRAVDELTGKEYVFKSKQVVNASGPWVDTLDGQDPGIRKDKLYLTKGVHIVVDHSRFPIQQAVYFDVGDKRMVFAIPREGKTYIGTTDTPYKGDYKEPGIELADKEYLIASVKKVFPKVQLSLNDIESYWSGLRPLIKQQGKSASAISRKDEIFTSSTGLISIAGGKLTGYRKMAERVTDLLVKRYVNIYDIQFCKTEKLILKGGDLKKEGGLRWYIQQKGFELSKLGIPQETAARLIRLYGTEIDQYVKEYKSIDSRLQSVHLPDWFKAQIQYTVKQELVCTPEDFIIRRTSDLYFRKAEAEAYAPELVKAMGILLGWDAARSDMYKKETFALFKE